MTFNLEKLLINYNNNNKTYLCEIMNYFNSDKSLYHNYTKLYNCLFNNHRETNIKLLEVGIGTINDNISANMFGWKLSKNDYIPGNSLRAWREYFINANIYGADIDRDILFNEDRINTFYIDQLNIDNNIIKNLPMFDIIIDDGLHRDDANLNTFNNLVERLNKGGLYIIEDLRPESIFSQYRPEVPGSYIFINLAEQYSPPDNCLWIFNKF